MRTPVIVLMACLMAYCQEGPRQAQQQAGALESTDPDVRVVKEYFEDGSVKSEIQAKGRQRHGITRTYSQDGILVSEVTYANNRRHGKTTIYYEDGSISSEIFYTNGYKSGEAFKYYPDGQLYRITPYRHNEIDGVRKTYWEDGTIQSELPYSQGREGMGLREYTSTGTLKEMDARINIKEVDEIAMIGKLTLKISLSDGSENVTFYRGELTEGKYWNDSLEPLVTTGGQAEIVFNLPRGSFVMETVGIVARKETRLRNPYILHRSYRVAAENKFTP